MKRARTEPSTSPNHRSKHDISYCEFYAGIGGWTMALKEALHSLSSSTVAECRAALDHSDLCKTVYEHNFGPCKTTRIERIPVDSPVFGEQVDIWLLSPPCQPHTRQHDNQEADMQDARSASFLHLCRMIQEMKELPSLIVLENVVGFEESSSCRKWREALADRNYKVAHFILQPTQVGLPNERPRYYCVAILLGSGLGSPKSDTEELSSGQSAVSPLHQYFACEKELLSRKDGDACNVTIHKSLAELGIVPIEQEDPTQLEGFLDSAPHETLVLPEKVWSKQAAWCLDICTGQSRRTACFTSSYGKFVRGTGSVLYTGNKERKFLEKPSDRQFQPDWAADLSRTDLRYFSGTELTRLFGFDSKFVFPPSTTLKQQWKLIGNSLNVRVASKLVELGLRALRYH